MKINEVMTRDVKTIRYNVPLSPALFRKPS